MPKLPLIRRSIHRVLVLNMLAILLIAPLALACTSKKSAGPEPSGAVNAPAANATAAAAGPTTPPDDAPLAQFTMHGNADDKGKPFDATGKIVVMGIDPATNVMQSPANKDDVAYYDFTSHPGFGCHSQGKCANTVLSGHVDWYTGQVGVFWNLRFMKEGDEIDLKLADGAQFKYKVVANAVYGDKDAPVQEIIGETPQESVTLITCDGVFNKQLQEYNARRVVRAVREA